MFCQSDPQLMSFFADCNSLGQGSTTTVKSGAVVSITPKHHFQNINAEEIRCLCTVTFDQKFSNG